VAGLLVQLFDQDHGFTRSLGLRVGGFGYSTDAVDLDAAALAALGGVDTWVVGCFQRAEHRTHAWLDRVLGWVRALRPRRTVLTHMGTDMDWGWLQANLPAGVEPGHDGQVLEIPA
jgi:phosphoribosyl 1,2-cyclic phosphate phosphodiesterase